MSLEKASVLYIHGKGGNAGEAEHYRPLFPGCHVYGLDYRGDTCWETAPEIRRAVAALKKEYGSIILIANSIGAFFSMNAGIEQDISLAYFISPVVDMEKLIRDMMSWSGVTPEDLREKKTIATNFGETLSWEYFTYVKAHPISWSVRTEILYGSLDKLTSVDTISAFAESHSAGLTIMDGGEHWFHTDRQMKFLDNWIKEKSTELALK